MPITLPDFVIGFDVATSWILFSYGDLSIFVNCSMCNNFICYVIKALGFVALVSKRRCFAQ